MSHSTDAKLTFKICIRKHKDFKSALKIFESPQEMKNVIAQHGSYKTCENNSFTLHYG